LFALHTFRAATVATRVILLLCVVRASVDFHGQHLRLKVEIHEDVAITVQEDLFDFIENSVAVEQLCESHFRLGPIHQTLMPALQGMRHDFGIGALSTVGFEWVRTKCLESPARTDALCTLLRLRR
jgi:hypothetical protein